MSNDMIQGSGKIVGNFIGPDVPEKQDEIVLKDGRLSLNVKYTLGIAVDNDHTVFSEENNVVSIGDEFTNVTQVKYLGTDSRGTASLSVKYGDNKFSIVNFSEDEIKNKLFGRLCGKKDNLLVDLRCRGTATIVL